MNHIWFLFVRDIKNIVKNWVATVIILGLVFLPSLYAWFNIEASWDPYGQTSGIAIAVSNNDAGATLQGKPLNIGNEIITSLKSNEKIGWTFVDEATALKGVQRGDYYASLTIPADFSAKIATVLDDNPQKAEIIYSVNEKINAVSPKITAKGASGIIEEVNRNFVRTANGTIFQIFNEIGIGLESELPTIMTLKELLFKLEAMIPAINQAVAVAHKDMGKAKEIVGKAQSDLPLVMQLARDGEAAANQLNQFFDRTSSALETVAPSVKMNLLLLQQTALAAEQLTGIVQDASIDPAVAVSALEQAEKRLTLAIDVTGKVIAVLERLDRLTGGSLLSPVTGKLQQFSDTLARQAAVAGKIADAISRGERPAAELVASLNQLSAQASSLIGDILQRFDGEIQPRILQAVDKAKQASLQARTVLADANALLPDVQQILVDAANGLALGEKELNTIEHNLPGIESKIKALADQMRAFEKEGNLAQLIDLLKMNAGKESEFFAEPVILVENKLFPIPNYGSAMSPFFTTLSLWVGALLLVSLLSVEVHQHEPVYKSYQIYFGRFLTFVTLALLQSLMVTLGDIFILGTYVVNKLVFVLFGLLISAVFMLIVYTLVSVFGNVGKAMAIVLLVLQLAGSGGTFPIQVTPPFFQAIHPFLPFTYAISMMREAVGGILWDIAVRDMLMMAVYAALFLVIGLALKKVINRASAKLVAKAKESKLIH